MMADTEIDATKVTSIVKEFFQSHYGNLGILLFRIEKVQPNTEKDKWIVECSLYTSLGESKRTTYRLKVDVSTGRILEVEIIATST